MIYGDNGTTLTILGKTFSLAEVSMSIDDTNLANGSISIKVAGKGGAVELGVPSDIPCQVVIPEEAQSWIDVIQETTDLMVKPNAEASRHATVIVKSEDGSFQLSYLIEQETDEQLVREREALIAIYKALDGDNWNNNKNWCSDKPVGEWYGVQTDENGCVFQLHFVSNNLSGVLLDEIVNLSKLNVLEIYDEPNVYGTIPEAIGALENLESLLLMHTGLEGTIPSSVAGCKQLGELAIAYNPKMTGSLPTELYNLPIHAMSIQNQPSLFFGVFPDDIGKLSELESLTLCNNALQGSIPVSISQLSNLGVMDLAYNLLDGGLENIQNLPQLSEPYLNMNRFSGNIPSSLTTLPNLTSLYLWGNLLTGSIPKEFGKCQNLRVLNLIFNYLDGTISEELRNAPNLTSLDFSQNCFKGKYPKWLLEDERFRDAWRSNSHGNLFDLDNMPAPIFEIKDIDGKTLSSNLYKENNYTIFINATPDLSIENFKNLYRKYQHAGIEIISLVEGWNFPPDIWDDEEKQVDFIYKQAKDYIAEYSIPWRCAALCKGNHISHYMDQGHDVYDAIPIITVVNKHGEIVYYYDSFYPTGYEIDEPGWMRFLTTQLGEVSTVGYTSTDYSQDGKVNQIQKATIGKGIDLVIMGDGFSDELIEDGTYDSEIQKAINALFVEEPYASNKNLFNIYSVTVISANEDFGGTNSTALDCYFEEKENSTRIGANNARCITYALKVISEERLDDATVIVILNKDRYAGTCYMYCNGRGDYGRGLSIGFVPMYSEEAIYKGLVSHEIGGHGFAKLADEYAYDYMGAFPTSSDLPEGVFVGSVKADPREQEAYGWWKNVDFTNDPAQVKWSQFLSDDRYANEGLGCYEGGLTYWSGVWRPTENSIMNTNTGGFNAPSRYAIWYRIGKLAHGEDWEGGYEDFVAYDQVNRTPAAAARRKAQQRNYVEKPLPPLHAPVVVGHSWRGELQKGK